MDVGTRSDSLGGTGNLPMFNVQLSFVILEKGNDTSGPFSLHLTYRTYVRYTFSTPMFSPALRAQLESSFGGRITTPFTDLAWRVGETVSTGIAALDTRT